jgi:dTDP-4-dehydrorhamnose reductase
MRAIVVGARGYVGAALLARARALGGALGTSSTGADGMARLDLREPAAFDYAQIGAGDVVFLAAGISAPDACAADYDAAYAVNVAGTAQFIERAMQSGARVIFFSSDTVYGETAADVDESAACHPAGAYGRMKHEVESRFAGQAAFKAARLSFVFSRRDQFTRYLLDCARKGVEAKVFQPFSRAVIHLDDVLDGLLALAGRWDEFAGAALNIGGPEVLSRSAFAEIIRAAAAPSLAYAASAPPARFFVNRPAVIRMKSPRLVSLLGRPARRLAEAARLEFGTKEPG